MGLSDLLTVQGGLEKLRITAFEKGDYKTATESFLVLYNPTSFSESRSTKWLEEKNVNANSKEKSFRAVVSSKVTFEFMFDATGASPSSKNKPGTFTSENKTLAESATVFDATDLIIATNPTDSGQRHVNTALSEFFRITGTVKGETHQPHYLQINWGEFEFRGVLDSSTVNYKLFNTSGLPIRATLTANFVESISKEEEALKQKTESPDLTHYRIVKEGDSLPLISQRIYGDCSFYLELAKINKITNFRKLKVGQRIILPPIDKSSKTA